MWSSSGFNGDFRRRPQVSNRGASKKESKEQLLSRVQQERKQRERARIVTAAALRIQSWLRSVWCRRRERQRQRELWNQDKQHLDDTGDIRSLESSLRRLSFFFQEKHDLDRIVWTCQRCMSLQGQILELMSQPTVKVSWAFLVMKLHWQCLAYLGGSATDAQKNINALLRFFEVFTTVSYRKVLPDLWKSLASRNYFSGLRRLFDLRIPSSLEEYRNRAPTPMAESLFELMLRPLTAERGTPSQFLVYSKFTESFLAQAFSPQMEKFVLPALKESNFDYLSWLPSLDAPTLLANNCPCWLLYSMLYLGNKQAFKLEALDANSRRRYLSILSRLSTNLMYLRNVRASYGGVHRAQVADSADAATNTSDSDDDDDKYEEPVFLEKEIRCLRRSLLLLNESHIVANLMRCIEGTAEPDSIRLFCQICHAVLVADKTAIHNFKLLNTLAFKPDLIHRIWNTILITQQPTSVGRPIPLLTVLSRGLRVSPTERDAIVPLLAVFCSVFTYLLVTIDDQEFLGKAAQATSRQWMPFTLKELVPMSLALRDVTLGLIELAFPESRPMVREEYQLAVRSVRSSGEEQMDTSSGFESASSIGDTYMWSHLFRVAVELLHQLYTRDTRCLFCPEDHWICPNIHMPLDKKSDISLRRSRLRQYRPFRGLRLMSRQELEEDGPPLSTKEVRLATVLRDMPYTISFSQRVLVFHNLILRHKEEHQGETIHFNQGPYINILVRRNYIYEDAYEKLSQENEPNMYLRMRVQLMNAAGLNEAGIDGGGLFREFMTELLKTAFDPNRGFFRLTKDQQLYPNPNVEQIEQHFIPHYYFIGRMLGKALYENHLVELPLASFFLSKLLGQRSANVDIDHLSSLDTELHKNLLYLKTYNGEVKDLGLDFTVVSEEIGQTSVDELKPGGADIAVDNDNRIEYIHLMADYKLNRQIKAQCNAFRSGLSDVINLDWLRMFSHRELQILISGAEHEINVDDLRSHTKYGNGFHDQHETIKLFWTVVSEMTEKQKRGLLKFVTSCSRPPLLGFKDLEPSFGIQNVGNEDRLPTASTCMNLLKLPSFADKAILKNKLLYAIESGAGFELS